MNSHAVGEDPVAFRRKFLRKSPKHLAVLDAAADRVGGSEPAPQGLHRGVAVFTGYGSYVAAAAEISVDGDKIKLHLCARSRRLELPCGDAPRRRDGERDSRRGFLDKVAPFPVSPFFSVGTGFDLEAPCRTVLTY
jgi:hypothetical protein